MSGTTTIKLCAALVLALGTGLLHADPYCCPCKSGPAQTIDVGDDLKASFECTVACKRFTLARPGACETAAAPAPAAAAASSGSAVLLYRSDNCSGEAVKLDKSTAQLDQNAFYSFAVETGGPASVFAQTAYAGVRTAPVAPTICISPGFSILSMRLGPE
jgi:hypothetical protein